MDDLDFITQQDMPNKLKWKIINSLVYDALFDFYDDIQSHKNITDLEKRNIKRHVVQKSKFLKFFQ